MKRLITITALLVLTGLSAPASDANLDGWRKAVVKKLESTPTTFSTTQPARVEIIKQEAAARKLELAMEKRGDVFRVTVSKPTVAQH